MHFRDSFTKLKGGEYELVSSYNIVIYMLLNKFHVQVSITFALPKIAKKKSTFIETTSRKTRKIG